MAIPLGIKVSIGGLSVYFNLQDTILLVRVPTCCCITSVLRNGIYMSGLISSTVNLMLGSTELIWWRNVGCFHHHKGIIYIFNHRNGELGTVLNALDSKTS